MLDVPPSLVKWEANLLPGMGWAEVDEGKSVGAKESRRQQGPLQRSCDEVNKERTSAKPQ